MKMWKTTIKVFQEKKRETPQKEYLRKPHIERYTKTVESQKKYSQI